jgi:hypothetical protein
MSGQAAVPPSHLKQRTHIRACGLLLPWRLGAALPLDLSFMVYTRSMPCTAYRYASKLLLIVASSNVNSGAVYLSYATRLIGCHVAAAAAVATESS